MNSMRKIRRAGLATMTLGVVLSVPFLAGARELPAREAPAAGVATARALGKTFAAVAKRASDAVVFIQVEKGPDEDARNPLRNIPLDHPFFRFFGPPGGHQPVPQPRQQGQGSGVLVSSDGYILTNNHVVGGADVIKVKLNDGREFDAELVGTDPQSDVGVIRIKDARPLPSLPLGDSDALEVGEWVLAVGNPFGLQHSVTSGIVSALGRNRVGITDYENFIQTDAAINPGNSGGPLINLEGEVVGINTAIFSRSGGYMGIGFSIPINMAKLIYDQLVTEGTVRRGFLGIGIQDLTSDLADELGLKNSDGILVGSVEPGSAADTGGLRVGDVIVGLDGSPTKDTGAFRNAIAHRKPGTEVRLDVVRGGLDLKLAFELGERSDGKLASAGGSAALDELGLAAQDLTADLAQRFGYRLGQGVLISQVKRGSAAARAGIEPGDLVLEVDRQPVNSAAELASKVGQSLQSGKVLLLVRDGRMARYVVLRK